MSASLVRAAEKLSGLNLKKLLLNKWFLAILAVKVVMSFLFAADVMTQGFYPFVDYFVSSGIQNPYNYFAELGQLKAFPYSSMMLWIMAIPRIFLFFIFSAESVNFLSLFGFHLPILAADVLIYLILCKLLETREKKVLLFYWASPILIFINYFHGQLDILPTAALLLSLLFLFRKRETWAFIILGFGLAIKTHLIAALPLFIIYLYINKEKPLNIAKLTGYSLLTYFLLVAPYLFSEGYSQMVLQATEQKRLFLLKFPYGFGNVDFLIAPGIYLVLLFRFASYKKINQDLFMVIMALIFSVLVILVPPMPGWFYWSVPFLAYFYIKQSGAPSINFWALNAIYILYFIFQPDSAIMESFQLISPALANGATPYELLAAKGLPAQTFANLLFTALTASMALNVLWCYKAGIKSNKQYRSKESSILIGVAGDSGSGKTTFGLSLKKLMGKGNCIEIQGDDVHKWPRGHKNWDILTHLNPKSNNLHLEIKHAMELKDGDCIHRPHYDHSTGTFTEPIKIDSNKFILFSGLHTLYLKRLRDILDIKIFIDPDEDLRTHWKIVRDIKERGYSKKRVLDQLEKRSKDSQKFIKPQREKADIIFSYVPSKKIQNIGSLEEKVKVKLRIYCENSLHLEPMIEELCNAGLEVHYWHEDDLDTQCFECSGKITAENVKQAAFNIIPNLRELLHNMEPEFEANYEGIRQLFVLYYLSEISTFKRNHEQ